MHKLHAATNTKNKTYYIFLADGLKTILDLECVQIVRIHNIL